MKKNNPNKALIKHDKILADLEQRIKEYNRYTIIAKNVNYETSEGVRGEVDLLCYDSKYNYWHFYEVKSNVKTKYHFKAFRQYQKFIDSFPELNIKGILVNDKHIYRLGWNQNIYILVSLY